MQNVIWRPQPCTEEVYGSLYHVKQILLCDLLQRSALLQIMSCEGTLSHNMCLQAIAITQGKCIECRCDHKAANAGC